MFKNVLNQRGQVLLTVIVTMVVSLTVGLILVSRTITNLKISKQNEDSQRAFQAASAGIEKYVNQQSGGSNNLINATFNTSVKTLQGNTLLLNNGDKVDQDRGIDLWLSSYPSFSAPLSGDIIVYWGTSDQNSCSEGTLEKTTPAIEVILLSGAISSPTLSKYVYDPCAARRSSNGFTAPNPGGTVNGMTFSYSSPSIVFTNGLVTKVIPLYNSGVVGVVYSGASFLPPQGKVIESTGVSGDITRKIVYYESYPQIPNEVFPYAILSQ